MKLACLWNDENERSIIEHEIRSAEPTWELVFFPWKQVSAMGPLLDILRSDYSAILLHLSLPPCAALTLSELRHRDKLSTQIVLTSRTPADPDALSTLFSGRIHPESDVYRVASKISSIVDTPPRYLSEEELERAIVSVINSDDLVRVQFMEIFHEKRLRKMLTFDDYKRFCHASLIAASIKSSRVFISYAAKDQKIAEELREALTRRGIIAFMASRDVKGGDLWEPSIREAIVACSEMLVVITPNSKDRPWIMIEVGAGWALGKHVTPCLAFVDVSEVPEALSRSQARSILTKKDRDALIKELSNRLGISKKSQVASRS